MSEDTRVVAQCVRGGDQVCPTCWRSDADYPTAAARGLCCNDPWHGDDHLRKASPRSGQMIVDVPPERYRTDDHRKDIQVAWDIIGRVENHHDLNSTEGHLAILRGIQYGRQATSQFPGASENKWQPIGDYVPGHDNDSVLAAHDGQVSEAYYNGGDDNWYKAGKSPHDFDFVNSDLIFPTHWQPLPLAPVSSTERGNG